MKSEPMTDERLAEFQTWRTAAVYKTEHVLELTNEINRLRNLVRDKNNEK